MPERWDRLRGTIHELETELNGIASLDEESRRLLLEASAEIQAALRKSDATSLSSGSTTDRLRDAAQSFETSHPTLAGVVHRVIDALGQWGI